MFKRTRLHHLFGALALALCSAPAAAPAFAAADFPTGTYAAKGLPATVTFDDQGRLRVNKGAVMEVDAEYTITGDQLQVTDRSGPWACTKAGQQTGTYRWKADHGTLTFSKVADKCKDRSRSLIAQPWKKKP